MTYHIVLSRPTDLGVASEGARAGTNPRHSMAELADRLGGRVHDGLKIVPDATDHVLATLTRMRPLWWALARDLKRHVQPGDVIYCAGEDVGQAVAVMCGRMHDVRIAVSAHRVDSPKKRLALRLLELGSKVDRFIAVSKPQYRFLSQFLRQGATRAQFVFDQTDTDFFSPGPSSPDKRRPLIVSVGLEQRDYSTLADATADLDLDVRISGFSPDTRVLSRAFPAAMPGNMSRRFYAWPDLAQLYRDADLIVVSLFPNSYAAGVQGLMEGLSSGRPVIVTASPGLEGYLDRQDAMVVVPPNDPAALRAVVRRLLADPAERQRLGEAARSLSLERHRCDQWLDEVSSILRSLDRREAARAA